jgi:hypothetical protein
MFLQTTITAFQLMFSTGIFAHEMRIKASKVSNFKWVRRRLSSLRKNLLKIAGGDVPGGTLQQVRNR